MTNDPQAEGATMRSFLLATALSAIIVSGAAAAGKVAMPKLVKVIRSHNLEVPMITTDIVDADSPGAEELSLAARH